MYRFGGVAKLDNVGVDIGFDGKRETGGTLASPSANKAAHKVDVSFVDGPRRNLKRA